jgi:hypothetical protein
MRMTDVPDWQRLGKGRGIRVNTITAPESAQREQLHHRFEPVRRRRLNQI